MTPDLAALVADAKRWDRCYPGNMSVERLVDELTAALESLAAEFRKVEVLWKQAAIDAERERTTRQGLERAGEILLAQAERAEAERDALRLDAKRFVWTYSDTPKPSEWINEYLRGVREHWTLDQWRASIDAAIDAAIAQEGK